MSAMTALTYSVGEAACLLGISRALAYRQASTGWLVPGVRVLRVGRRYIVPRVDVTAVLKRPAR